MLKEFDDAAGIKSKETTRHNAFSSKKHYPEFMTTIAENDEMIDHGANHGLPIADLFPAVTIMFADIVGFTAWSDSREPAQVFQLLETLYGSFDAIAKRRRVFKVETVGDCYGKLLSFDSVT